MPLSSGLPSIESQLDEFSTRVRAEIDQLDAQEHELQEQMTIIRRTKARYERILRVLATETPKSRKKGSGRPPSPDGPIRTDRGIKLNRKVSLERAEAVARVIADLGVEEFTVAEIGTSMGLDEKNRTKVYDTINALREIEYLGKVGHRKTPGKPALFRILDSDALTRLKESLDA